MKKNENLQYYIIEKIRRQFNISMFSPILVKTRSNNNSGRDFSNWIKGCIDEYEFIVNQDYEVFAQIGENSNGGRSLKEYTLTLDMTKELSMVEKIEKGKQACRYFIEMEKIALQAKLLLVNNNNRIYS